jgi:hypothetical protein
MSRTDRILRGGCLCGAVRYEAVGEPLYSGFCYCGDCRKASGAGAVPFMGYRKEAFRVSGETKQARKALRSGRTSVRNFCPACGSLLFGGEHRVSAQHTIYAGTLDDPSAFHPTQAINMSERPHWAAVLEGLDLHDGMPGAKKPDMRDATWR